MLTSCKTSANLPKQRGLGILLVGQLERQTACCLQTLNLSKAPNRHIGQSLLRCTGNSLHPTNPKINLKNTSLDCLAGALLGNVNWFHLSAQRHHVNISTLGIISMCLVTWFPSENQMFTCLCLSNPLQQANTHVL